ncbi:MAG: NusA-like transcription termination signal-binding factor [Candidatus Micrarchaeota archaeon]|nr:NusA-like transcription termination signal-binding factor [Candidatus Micrarchaeota archaeon]
MKLGDDEIRSISLFQSITGAGANDCLIGEDSVTFVVRHGELGRAIGRGGSAIQRAMQTFKRRVFVVEDAETPEDFAKNLFAPIKVNEAQVVEFGEAKTVYVTISSEDRGTAIGRNGERIKRGRALLKRRFNAELKLITEEG